MPEKQPSKKDLIAEINDLRQRLDEAEDTLRAIRQGEVDALVVSTPEGEQIVAAPTLIKELPEPLRRIIGDMSSTEKMLVGLDLKPKK